MLILHCWASFRVEVRLEVRFVELDSSGVDLTVLWRAREVLRATARSVHERSASTSLRASTRGCPRRPTRRDRHSYDFALSKPCRAASPQPRSCKSGPGSPGDARADTPHSGASARAWRGSLAARLLLSFARFRLYRCFDLFARLYRCLDLFTFLFRLG